MTNTTDSQEQVGQTVRRPVFPPEGTTREMAIHSIGLIAPELIEELTAHIIDLSDHTIPVLVNLFEDGGPVMEKITDGNGWETGEVRPQMMWDDKTSQWVESKARYYKQIGRELEWMEADELLQQREAAAGF